GRKRGTQNIQNTERTRRRRRVLNRDGRNTGNIEPLPHSPRKPEVHFSETGFSETQFSEICDRNPAIQCAKPCNLRQRNKEEPSRTVIRTVKSICASSHARTGEHLLPRAGKSSQSSTMVRSLRFERMEGRSQSDEGLEGGSKDVGTKRRELWKRQRKWKPT